MAADPRITQYIREQMAAGFRKQQISEALLQAGWYKEEIDQAFYEVVNQAYQSEPEAAPAGQAADELHPKKPLPQNPSSIWKLRKALLHPGAMSEAVNAEKGIGKALGFFIIVTVIDLAAAIAFAFFSPGTLTGLLTGLISDSPVSGIIRMLPLLIQVDIVSLLIDYALIFAAALLGVALIHAFVWMLRGGKGFGQTFKAVMYSFAPFIFLWIFIPLAYLIPQIGSVSLLPTAFAAALALWQLVILVKGLSKMHGSTAKAAGAVFIPAAIILAVAVLVPLIDPALLSMLNPSTYIGGSGSATGFGELGLPSQWQYSYDGSFSIMLRNGANLPVSMNSVTANCATGGSTIVLETLDPLHLEPGTTISYSGGDQKCESKSPGDSYSVSLTVRYLDSGNMLQAVSGTVAGVVR